MLLKELMMSLHDDDFESRKSVLVRIFSEESECKDMYDYSLESLQSKPYLVQEIKKQCGADVLKGIPIRPPYSK